MYGEENLISGKYIYYRSENEFIIKRLNLLTMKKQLEKIWQHYTPLLSSEIMLRGFMYCENCGPQDILITGINPSWREEKDKKEINHFRFNSDILFNSEGDVYWSPVKKMLHSVEGTIDYRGNAAYLDVLYFREKKQDKIRKNILKNEHGIAFIAEQLNLTQHTIEKIISPKVIIIKNRTSSAYWGKEAEKGIIWMGYDFKFIKSHRCGEICRIEGLIDSLERIAPEITDTNLKGTIVLFAKHINQYTSKMERSEVEDIDELLELYKANNI